MIAVSKNVDGSLTIVGKLFPINEKTGFSEHVYTEGAAQKIIEAAPTRRLLGTVLPASAQVRPELRIADVAVMVEHAWVHEGSLWVRLKTLDTPPGNTLKRMIEADVGPVDDRPVDAPQYDVTTVFNVVRGSNDEHITIDYRTDLRSVDVYRQEKESNVRASDPGK